jgi:hypothetical protein
MPFLARRVFVSATSRDLTSHRRVVAEELRERDKDTHILSPLIQDEFSTDQGKIERMIRRRMKGCEIVICLVGFTYGAEPKGRSFDPSSQPESRSAQALRDSILRRGREQWRALLASCWRSGVARAELRFKMFGPLLARVIDTIYKPEDLRRSYTQLEYEIARRSGKKVYTFLALDGADFDAPADEPAELVGLQGEHRDRIAGIDDLYYTYQTKEELRALVRKIDLPNLRVERLKRILVSTTAAVVIGTLLFINWYRRQDWKVPSLVRVTPFEEGEYPGGTPTSTLVEARFDEPMAGDMQFRLAEVDPSDHDREVGKVEFEPPTLVDDGRTIRLAPKALLAGKTYRVTLTGARDRAGNPIDARSPFHESFPRDFRTRQPFGVDVRKTSPTTLSWDFSTPKPSRVTFKAISEALGDLDDGSVVRDYVNADIGQWDGKLIRLEADSKPPCVVIGPLEEVKSPWYASCALEPGTSPPCLRPGDAVRVRGIIERINKSNRKIYLKNSVVQYVAVGADALAGRPISPQ